MNIVLPDGSVKELEEGATVADVAASIGAGLARAALAGIVNDTPVDLDTVVSDGDSVAIVTAKSDEGLELMRHSTAHLLAFVSNFFRNGISLSQKTSIPGF